MYGPEAPSIPAFQPAARPRFSRSSTRTSGRRSRTSSSVPSVEPASTRIVSCARTLARQVSSQGNAFRLTTTTLTSAMADARPAESAQALPAEDRRARQRERERDEEEAEPRRERGVRVDVQPAAAVHEERLADGAPVYLVTAD